LITLDFPESPVKADAISLLCGFCRTFYMAEEENRTCTCFPGNFFKDAACCRFTGGKVPARGQVQNSVQTSAV
jgi:hypothetical protein